MYLPHLLPDCSSALQILVDPDTNTLRRRNISDLNISPYIKSLASTLSFAIKYIEDQLYPIRFIFIFYPTEYFHYRVTLIFVVLAIGSFYVFSHITRLTLQAIMGLLLIFSVYRFFIDIVVIILIIQTKSHILLLCIDITPNNRGFFCLT